MSTNRLDNFLRRAQDRIDSAAASAAAAQSSASSSIGRSSNYSTSTEFAIQNDFIKLPKFRSLEDFLYNIDRYEIPNHGNLDRLKNRMMNNLLYYQTNYILTFLISLLFIFILHPQGVLFGMVFVTGLIYGANWVLQNQVEFENIRENRPQIIFFGAFIIWTIFVRFLSSIAVSIFGCVLPIFFVMAHCAFRKRNLMNKMNAAKTLNKLHAQTPVGMVLESFGVLKDLRVL